MRSKGHWKRIFLVMGLSLGLSPGGIRLSLWAEAPDMPTPPKPAVKIVINIPSRTLMLRQGEKTLRTYPVGVGRPAFPTPLGTFRVIHLFENPGWEQPYKPVGVSRIGPHTKDNPLGTRWIGFHLYHGGEYGIHGTNNPSSVGKFSSHGCIRMKIADAEDLFQQVSIGTPVQITYETFQARQQQGKVYLIHYPDLYHQKNTSLASAQSVLKKTFPQFAIPPKRLKELIQRTPFEKPIALGNLPVVLAKEPPPPAPAADSSE